MTLNGETTTVGMAPCSLRRVQQNFVQLMVTDQSNRRRRQSLANDRVAQGAELGLALDSVAGHIGRFDVTRVAAQFRDAVLDFRFEHSREALHTDLFEVGFAAPLPIEL